MTEMIIAGCGALTCAGVGTEALADRLAAPARRADTVDGPSGEETLPPQSSFRIPDFDVRTELGRKGTSTYDRATALAVVCARDALVDAGLAEVDDHGRTRMGVVLGTTLGSFRSTSDYSRDTLVGERPYLVNPALFPNSVMNGAAGQVAIRFGLTGPNATITGGPLGFLNAVRYADNAIGRGYADVLVTGAVEEFSEHRAWARYLADPDAPVGAGEAAVAVVLAGTRPPTPGTRELGRVLGVATAYGAGGGARADTALEGCVRRALHRAGIDASAIGRVLTAEAVDDRSESGPAARVLGREVERLLVAPVLGRCDAADGAVALAALLGSGDDRPALLTGRGADGAVGAAVVRGGAR